MKQAILYGVGDLRIDDVPLQAEPLQPDQIYVETEVSALSTGTDLGNYLGILLMFQAPLNTQDGLGIQTQV